MHQQPQLCEVREGFPLEYAAQVGFDIGGAGEAGIAADEAKEKAVRAQAPEDAVASVEPVLYRRCGRTPAPVCRQMSARVIEIVGRWHDHDRHAAIKTLKRHRKLPLTQGSYPDAPHISEAEHVVQELLDESDRGRVRRGLACSQIGNERLANAKIACDF